jgi:hypothetical protein
MNREKIIEKVFERFGGTEEEARAHVDFIEPLVLEEERGRISRHILKRLGDLSSAHLDDYSAGWRAALESVHNVTKGVG